MGTRSARRFVSRSRSPRRPAPLGGPCPRMASLRLGRRSRPPPKSPRRDGELAAARTAVVPTDRQGLGGPSIFAAPVALFHVDPIHVALSAPPPPDVPLVPRLVAPSVRAHASSREKGGGAGRNARRAAGNQRYGYPAGTCVQAPDPRRRTRFIYVTFLYLRPRPPHKAQPPPPPNPPGSWRRQLAAESTVRLRHR